MSFGVKRTNLSVVAGPGTIVVAMPLGFGGKNAQQHVEQIIGPPGDHGEARIVLVSGPFFGNQTRAGYEDSKEALKLKNFSLRIRNIYEPRDGTHAIQPSPILKPNEY